jgi:hypothetical protein
MSRVDSDTRLKRKKWNKNMQYVERSEPICKGKQTHIRYGYDQQSGAGETRVCFKSELLAAQRFRQGNDDRVLERAKLQQPETARRLHLVVMFGRQA